MRSPHRCLAGSLCLVLTATATSIAGQEKPGPDSLASAAPVSATEVEEIVVTITKREESIQEVGGTIAAFDDDVIENANIENVGDLIGLLPNLQVKSEDGDLSIRGVARAAFDSQSPVAFHVNGLYHASTLAYVGQFYDLESVQVAIGPSGTLYGRNANAGAIDIRWRAPHSDFEVIADTTWAPEFDNYQFRTAINLPISGVDNELLNARFALIREVQDGPINNPEDTERNSFGAKDDWSARLFLRSQPTDAMSVDFHVRYFKGDRRYAGGTSLLPAGQAPVGVLPFGAVRLPYDWANGFVAFKNAFTTTLFGIPVCTPVPVPPCIPNANVESLLLNGGGPLPPLVRDAQFFTPLPSSRFRPSRDSVHSRLFELGSGFLEMWDLDANVAFDLAGLPALGDVRLQLLAGYGEIENEGLSDSDFTEYAALDTRSGQLPEKRTTIELRAQSGNDGSWLNWTLGFFYVKNDIHQDRDVLTPLTISGASVKQVDTGYAPFVNVTLTPIDPLEIFLGVRWNRDETSRFEDSNPTPLTPAFQIDGGKTFKQTTGDVQVKWFLTEDRRHMLYAKWARGYKAGFIQLINNLTGPQVVLEVQPENIRATEVGAKTRWFDGRLNLNTSFFYYDYRDLQVPSIDVVSITNRNAEEARVFGVEATLDAVPIENASLRVAWSWLDARFERFCLDEPLNPNYGAGPKPVEPACVGNLNGGLDLAGNQMEDSPDFKLSLLANYRWDLGSGGVISPTVEFTWTADAWRRPLNNPVVDRVAAYTKTDLRLRWEESKGRYWLEAFGENLENNHVYPRGIVVAVTGTAQGFGLLQPRTYGLRLGFDWRSGD
jgi:iron complex outermembrane receptor protein